MEAFAFARDYGGPGQERRLYLDVICARERKKTDAPVQSAAL